MSEQDLLKALQQGSLKAFEEMLTAYERRIYTYLLRLVSNPDDAADLTQETFLKVYRFLHNINPEKNFKSWLYTIATNTAYDWLRKKRGIVNLFPDDEEAETNQALPAYTLNEERLDVEKALEAIRPGYRAVLLMFFTQRMSYEEISIALSLPINTVKTHIRRGKEALKKELHGYYG